MKHNGFYYNRQPVKFLLRDNLKQGVIYSMDICRQDEELRYSILVEKENLIYNYILDSQIIESYDR